MAQWVRTLGLIPSTHVAASNCVTPVSDLFWPLQVLHIFTDIQGGKVPKHKIKKERKKKVMKELEESRGGNKGYWAILVEKQDRNTNNYMKH